eukprot:15365384-Ditylum_brightwellii.AAC.1
MGGDFFQFTAEVWNPPTTSDLPTSLETINKILLEEEWKKWKKKVKLVAKETFPYLDMQLSWKMDNLSFLVYHKKKQTIKYVNKESCRQTAVFKAIPTGVFIHMGRLTLITEENRDMPITSLYPTHAAALKKSKLLPKKIPTVRELCDQELAQKEKQKLKKAEKEKRKDK